MSVVGATVPEFREEHLKLAMQELFNVELMGMYRQLFDDSIVRPTLCVMRKVFQFFDKISRGYEVAMWSRVMHSFAIRYYDIKRSYENAIDDRVIVHVNLFDIMPVVRSFMPVYMNCEDGPADVDISVPDDGTVGETSIIMFRERQLMLACQALFNVELMGMLHQVAEHPISRPTLYVMRKVFDLVEGLSEGYEEMMWNRVMTLFQSRYVDILQCYNGVSDDRIIIHVGLFSEDTVPMSFMPVVVKSEDVSDDDSGSFEDDVLVDSLTLSDGLSITAYRPVLEHSVVVNVNVSSDIESDGSDSEVESEEEVRQWYLEDESRGTLDWGDMLPPDSDYHILECSDPRSVMDIDDMVYPGSVETRSVVNEEE